MARQWTSLHQYIQAQTLTGKSKIEVVRVCVLIQAIHTVRTAHAGQTVSLITNRFQPYLELAQSVLGEAISCIPGLNFNMWTRDP